MVVRIPPHTLNGKVHIFYLTYNAFREFLIKIMFIFTVFLIHVYFKAGTTNM